MILAARVALVIVIVLGIPLLAVGHFRSRGSVEYIVLVRTTAPTPSETVTAWNAYEAAPQLARSGQEALDSFRRDSGLTGPMVAVPLSVWRASRLRP